MKIAFAFAYSLVVLKTVTFLSFVEASTESNDGVPPLLRRDPGGDNGRRFDATTSLAGAAGRYSHDIDMIEFEEVHEGTFEADEIDIHGIRHLKGRSSKSSKCSKHGDKRIAKKKAIREENDLYETSRSSSSESRKEKTVRGDRNNYEREVTTNFRDSARRRHPGAGQEKKMTMKSPDKPKKKGGKLSRDDNKDLKRKEKEQEKREKELAKKRKEEEKERKKEAKRQEEKDKQDKKKEKKREKEREEERKKKDKEDKKDKKKDKDNEKKDKDDKKKKDKKKKNRPTQAPTFLRRNPSPTVAPTLHQTPTTNDGGEATDAPSDVPSMSPSNTPSMVPSDVPSSIPSSAPSMAYRTACRCDQQGNCISDILPRGAPLTLCIFAQVDDPDVELLSSSGSPANSSSPLTVNSFELVQGDLVEVVIENGEPASKTSGSVGAGSIGENSTMSNSTTVVAAPAFAMCLRSVCIVRTPVSSAFYDASGAGTLTARGTVSLKDLSESDSDSGSSSKDEDESVLEKTGVNTDEHQANETSMTEGNNSAGFSSNSSVAEVMDYEVDIVLAQTSVGGLDQETMTMDTGRNGDNNGGSGSGVKLSSWLVPLLVLLALIAIIAFVVVRRRRRKAAEEQVEGDAEL